MKNIHDKTAPKVSQPFLVRHSIPFLVGFAAAGALGLLRGDRAKESKQLSDTAPSTPRPSLTRNGYDAAREDGGGHI